MTCCDEYRKRTSGAGETASTDNVVVVNDTREHVDFELQDNNGAAVTYAKIVPAPKPKPAEREKNRINDPAQQNVIYSELAPTDPHDVIT